MSTGSHRDKTAGCPSCGNTTLEVFYRVAQVPVHSVLLFPTQQEAIGYPRGDLEIALCSRCGFITNLAFREEHIELSARYEETQGFSATFQEFHRSLAASLVERFGLRGKRILEIGSGKSGDFLHLLCEMGDNQGVGFDPVYVPERDSQAASGRTRFVRDLYSEAYAGERADFICCKMTLEHIPNTLEFMTMVRRAVEQNPAATVFFQVPEMRRILDGCAFWDIYYEHCSYFLPGPLARLFERSGFEVLDLWNAYDGQLLMIAARPASLPVRQWHDSSADVAETATLARRFALEVGRSIAEWDAKIEQMVHAGESAVVWGAGSKAVAFLSKIKHSEVFAFAVDVNPFKHGTYLPGTGHRIIGPEELRQVDPDLVLLMNPIYEDEVSRELNRVGVATKLVSLETSHPH